MPADLEARAAWRRDRQVVAVVLDATGVDWQPVSPGLEAAGGFRVVRGNAEHRRAVPGRKPDVQDAHGLAHLLQQGLVRASVLPDREQREVRERPRERTALVRARAREVNRRQQTREAATSKLAAVLADVPGVSGQASRDARVHAATAPAPLVDRADVTVPQQRPARERALVGTVSGTRQFLVERPLRPLRELAALLAACDTKGAEWTPPFAAQLARLQTSPGVGLRPAAVIRAAVGTALSRFPTDRQAAAWAGVCPGQNISAGTRRQARSRQGRPGLRGARADTAWAAARSRDTDLAAHARQLTARRGHKRASVAVSHTILVLIDPLLQDGTEDQDLGPAYPLKRTADRVRRRSIQQLEARGYEVNLKRPDDAA
jgi:transposase